jgi:ABC-2 type transport system permease protein
VSAASETIFLSPLEHALVTVRGTARAYLRRNSAYLIQLIRWPLGPTIAFATWRLTYAASGRAQVDGASAAGFLLVGMFGLITWSSAIWASGYAIEWERQEGTSAALFLSPASRAAVVAGYGLGSLIWYLPSFAAILLLGFLTGARLVVTDPLALGLAALSLVVASLAAGFFFSGLFILSRRGNLIANFLQGPIYLLGGFMVPRSRLPGILHPLSNAIPASHAVDALRATALSGASLSHAGPEIGLAFAVSAVYVLIGLIGLRRVERVAKRSGQLDLY